MKVRVQVFYPTLIGSDYFNFPPFRDYVMDHNDPSQRRVLGEQCRNAFEGGQVIVTRPLI